MERKDKGLEGSASQISGLSLSCVADPAVSQHRRQFVHKHEKGLDAGNASGC